MSNVKNQSQMQKIKAYMNINEFKENPMIKEAIDKNIFNFRYSLPSEEMS